MDKEVTSSFHQLRRSRRKTNSLCSLLIFILTLVVGRQLFLVSKEVNKYDIGNFYFPPILSGAQNIKDDLVWDDAINVTEEAARCKRYEFKYDGREMRRRIFWGSLIADDSWQILNIINAEVHGIYHSAALIESNTTQTLTPRHWRFAPGSQNLKQLTSMFGPRTNVTVDYYVDGPDPPNFKDRNINGLHREHLQRQLILERWKSNGMTPEDLGVVSDIDEVFTRDFLRALQICDVPQFRPGQDCHLPKIIGTAIVFEASPECVVARKKLWKPDMIIGECVDLIGDDTVHKPPKRMWKDQYSIRAPGHGQKNISDYEDYFNTVAKNSTAYPLFNAADFRAQKADVGQFQVKVNGRILHNGYHFHNFFDNLDKIRNKYDTFGEPVPDALTLPLEDICEDMQLVVECAKGLPPKTERVTREMDGYESIMTPRPIYFEQNEEYRGRRHEELKTMILEDEAMIQQNKSN